MIILGTNSIKDTGYDVDNSLRFNKGSSDYLNRTFGTSTSEGTWTYSVWLKISDPAFIDNHVFFSGGGASDNRTQLYFGETTGTLNIYRSISGSTVNLESDASFRDPSAWYNLCVQNNAGTVAAYINGVAVTLDGSSLGTNVINKSDTVHKIGRGATGTYTSSYMSEIVFIDGTVVAPTSFGEFDEDSGIWKPIDVSGLTFGTNGFYLDFEDSSALGNDAAGSNNFTVNNLTALDQSTDTCTNNFNTWLATDPRASNFTLSEGNLKIYRSGTVNPGQSVYAQSMMPTSGKWYVEAKIVDQPAGDTGRLGIANFESIPGNMIVTPQSSSPSSVNAVEVSFGTSGYVFFTINGSDTENSSAPGFSSGDIIMLAVDIDNGKFYVGSQGAWWNYSSSATGGDPTSGSGYVSNSSDLFNGSPICFHQGHSTGTSKTSSLEWNFGSPSFSISSGNTDGNGYGNFEYAVPSGYFALNTKNLAEYG